MLKDLFKKHLGLFGATVLLLVFFVSFSITKGFSPYTSELSFIEHSVLGQDAGSVIPASCDSATPFTSPTAAGGTAGSHFNGDCTTPCPSGIGVYDPYFNPTAAGCAPPIPTVSFTVNGCAGPITILKGDSEAFNWATTNADSCTASSNDQWSGIKGTSGNATQSAVVTSDFSLSCTGASGATTKTVHVDVTCTPVTGAWGTCDCDTETETRTNINVICLPWTETQDCPAIEKNKCRDFNWKEVAP
jgi:hypothetical protein